MTTSADVRARLVGALRLDLVGPEPGDPHVDETLSVPPSRWYLTGFLVPWAAPANQKQDDDTQGELEMTAPAGPGDDDDTTPEPQAARRSQFPSSLGLSVLVPPETTQLRVTARWGDYTPREVGAKPDVEWDRHERRETVTVEIDAGLPSASLGAGTSRATADIVGAGTSRPTPETRATTGTDDARPVVTSVPDSRGLEIVTSVRRISRPQNLQGLPAGTRAVSVFLVNRRTPSEAHDELKDECSIFQATLIVEADQPFVPRPNPRGRDGNDPDDRTADLQYRDVMEYAVGHGTSTHAIVTGASCTRVETTWIPTAEVERVEPAKMPDVQLGMEALAAMPDAPAIREALAPLTANYRLWIDGQLNAAPSTGPQADVAKGLLQRAGLAADRIDAGLLLLDEGNVLDGFRLMNRAMAMAARQRRALEKGMAPDKVDAPAWRPFQLAFVLMNLRAFVDPRHTDRELVDLLFFPTGGGKTEAYLGLAAFVILLRRLRDPGLTSAGVAVLMRYTLRLLTLDQLGRATTLICALELIRQEPGMAGRLGAWPFEIGLWVGKAATPNRMGAKGEKDQTTARAKTVRFKNNSRRASPIPVETCPWCGTRFKPDSFQLTKTLPDGSWKTDADEPDHLRVLCLNSACRFKGKNPLPIVAVDEPLYRRVPCFVIATVDKFASLPWTGASGALLGRADRFDAAGFYGPWQPDVGQKLPKPLAPPDLIIQDELHLISGPLGTMAGLYETAIDALCTVNRDGHQIRPKVVASTATVRRAKDQIQALFTRDGVEVFPPPGPDRRTSFFAKTVPLSERPGRQYLGVAAQGRSLKVVLLRTYLALLGAAERHWQEAGGDKNPTNPADPYMTLVGYFNSLRELGGSRRIVEDEVASRVAGYGDRNRAEEAQGSFADRQIARDVCELTSRESTDKVSETKTRLAIGFSEKARAKDRLDVALATNMISVGLDITRLGLMVVLGQPKATAEYIQATSRVGRDEGKPGLVVTLLNIHRPRDRSHYERFEAFHASFYRAVEATSVTPFAPRALDRAMPALVVALARHLRPALTPARGALGMVAERSNMAGLPEILSQRARRHRTLTPDEEERINANLQMRVKDLLDSWWKVAKKQQEFGARLVYQRYEQSEGKALLRMPLEPADPDLGQDARRFKAPRSLRDVEPSVNLFVQRLDGTAVEMPSEGDAS